MSPRVPLTTLLSWTWTASIIETDNAVEAAASERLGRLLRISTPMWSNGLRAIDEAGSTVDEVRLRTRASCNLAGLERWGWITVGDVRSERRSGFGTQRGITGNTIVRPTRAGMWARRTWPRVIEEVENRWRLRFGSDVIDVLANTASPLVGSMPWSPPEIHPSDGFRTHVGERDNGDDHVHGETEDGGESGGSNGHRGAGDARSVAVLLGRVLTSLTIEHERGVSASLPVRANVLRVIDDGAVSMRDLVSRSGVSKEAMAMAAGFVERAGMAARRDDRTFALLVKGRRTLADYHERCARLEVPGLRAALEPVLHDPAQLAQGLVPPPGCWRAQRPYVTQTRRMLSDPTAALPWHPMVLHRGGWPDGA